MDTFVHGVGDEVLIVIILFLLIAIPSILFGIHRINWRTVIAHDSDADTQMENVQPDAAANAPPRAYNSGRCPICLNGHQLAIETNCGHLYCGTCLQTCILRSGLVTPISCPMCRQMVTMLFVCFTPEETESPPNSTIGAEMAVLYGMVENYNRRHSGAPRSIMETIRDMPTLLRHLWNEFFSVGGIMVMFRVRIGLCFLAAVLYLFSPLDIIPEAIFGIIGFLDDIFVFFVLLIYISIIYRRLISNRHMPP